MIYVVLARFSPAFLRLNLFLSLAVFLVWINGNPWWGMVTFLGLGVIMDVFSFAPFGHFFFLASVILLLVAFWKQVFSATQASLCFLFIFAPFVELLVEGFISMYARGICIPLWELILTKTLSIPTNAFFFLLWCWGGWNRNVG
ncbi:MAG: hypothetical protein HPY68_02070 [Candidatus Atribacteria bacterium]|nr:hypothetical protein [Candidatus Atribacteria bacterium]